MKTPLDEDCFYVIGEGGNLPEKKFFWSFTSQQVVPGSCIHLYTPTR